ncbi:MAG: Pr6Pr family membrane protein [Lachnospiraceae bacterium]|nr:Pr6Pr family membrane protein [Lachnospiraceae bacterium]
MYYFKKTIISYLCRIIFLILSGCCLLLHFSVNDASHNYYMLSYFTIISNLFCFIMILFYRHHTNRTYIFLYGMSLSGIIFTFFIYHFVMVEPTCSILSIHLYERPLCDLFAHYIIPLLYLIFWILFIPKNTYPLYYPILWTFYPAIYLLITLYRIFIVSAQSPLHLTSFPYFFLDIHQQGYLKFTNYIIALLFISLATGYLLIVLERLIILFCSLFYKE